MLKDMNNKLVEGGEKQEAEELERIEQTRQI
jgi:hypothetical protein